MGKANEPRSDCPINAAVEVFGDRWSLLVLRDIVFGDHRYFRELHAGSTEGIASNILADRLKKLVALGLLTREDTRPGQRARSAFAPSCSKNSAPRSGRSSWTSCAASTWAPNSQRNHRAFASA